MRLREGRTAAGSGRLGGGLIGRERELEALREMVAAGTRLVTLTGPPGEGKTRLALEAAEALRPSFAHGCVVVSLALIRSAADVPSAIARALGISDAAANQDDDPAAALAAGLGPRRLLLMLDNFEHVADAAVLVAELL